MQLVHRGTSAPRPVATPTSSRGMPRDLSEAQWPAVSEVEPANHSPPCSLRALASLRDPSPPPRHPITVTAICPALRRCHPFQP